MQEPQTLTKVHEFHKLFGAYIGKDFEMPPQEVANLRVSLLQEELDELKDAIAAGDMIEVADALTDIQYVLSGAVLAFGLQDKFKQCFDEVHSSNMSKACGSLEQAQETVEYHKQKKGEDSTIVQKDENTYLVYRVGDEKVMKSKYYTPANLKSIVG